jgi:hypothetical protein
MGVLKGDRRRRKMDWPRNLLRVPPAHAKLAGTAAKASNAWRNSRQMSSGSSIPTEIRIMPGEIPWRASCSSLCPRWLVDVGWLSVVWTSPKLGANGTSERFLMKV